MTSERGAPLDSTHTLPRVFCHTEARFWPHLLGAEAATASRATLCTLGAPHEVVRRVITLATPTHIFHVSRAAEHGYAALRRQARAPRLHGVTTAHHIQGQSWGACMLVFYCSATGARYRAWWVMRMSRWRCQNPGCGQTSEFKGFNMYRSGGLK